MSNQARPLTFEQALAVLAAHPAVMSADTAADAVGLSAVTLRRRIADGSLRAVRTQPGRGGQFRILKTDLAHFLVGLSA